MAELKQGLEGVLRSPGHFLNGERVALWRLMEDGTIRVLALTGPHSVVAPAKPDPIDPSIVEWDGYAPLLSTD